MIKKKFNKVKIVLIFQPCIQVLHFIGTHITMGKKTTVSNKLYSKQILA